MKITYKQLVDSVNSLSAINTIKSIKLIKKISISKTIKKIMTEIDTYNECFKSLRLECVELKDGEEVIKDGQVIWTDENRFNSELQELMKKEIEIDVNEIPSADLGEGSELGIGDLVALDWLIK